VVLSVSDNGPGVPEAEHSRIFDRFYRVPGTPGRGSGIGLSLVSRIANLHQATVEVGPGLQGRGFSITLCFSTASERPAVQAEPTVAAMPLPVAQPTGNA
jgi:two-component system OmpR family sensor kinase